MYRSQRIVVGSEFTNQGGEKCGSSLDMSANELSLQPAIIVPLSSRWLGVYKPKVLFRKPGGEKCGTSRDTSANKLSLQPAIVAPLINRR